MRLTSFTCLALLCAVLSTGCVYMAVGAAGAGLGVGTYKYVKGELDVVYEAGYGSTWDAALSALDALGITRTSADKDAFGGLIKATRAGAGTKIKIAVTPITSKSTSVRIRVGFFGNRTQSERIAEEIKTQLKK